MVAASTQLKRVGCKAWSGNWKVARATGIAHAVLVNLRSLLGALACITAFGAACSESAGGDGLEPIDGTPSAAQDSVTGARFASNDSGPADATPRATDTAGATDSAGAIATVGGPSTCDFPADPKPGEPGATCTSSEECDSGYCIEGPGGKICTKTCSACCPTGFLCEAASVTDPQFVCRAKLNALCRPCLNDAECAASSPGALCVGDATSGRFCGGSCEDNKDCYSGFGCKEAKGTQGSGKQCVKISGECTCSPAFVLQGATTSCSVQNAAGSCKGLRTCQKAGLSACDAPMPATETCNGQDDNCDGTTDELGAAGCTTYYSDGDSDGFGAVGDPGLCLCKPEGKTTALQAGDCDDANPKVKAGQTETCNGIDDDCDGFIDQGFPDTDGDLVADCVDPDIDNDGSANIADCAPANADISPAATETCNGVDDNCNGAIDEPGSVGCKGLYTDLDGDGFGKSFGSNDNGTCLCKAVGKVSATSGDDCDDTALEVNPKATEVCNNKDDNCDGQTDKGCDDDQDGYCDGKMEVIGSPPICSQGVKDCDDLNAALSPGAKEICGNTIDDNCDGMVDDGANAKDCINYFKDADKDGFGAGNATCLCGPMDNLTATNNKDCNDGNALQSPGKAEQCNNNIDDNCNGVLDEEDALGCEAYYTDPDGDGYGDKDQACLCGPSETYVTKKGGDCKAANPEISPGATEACNGIDDNCKNGIDELGAKGCIVYYADKDGDGIGDTVLSKCLCKSEAPYTATAKGDCDDTKAEAKPGATELCDGFDNDCNGQVDEMGADGCKVYYIDKDGDKFGTPASAACLCSLGGDYNATKGGDCADDDKAIHPSAQEFCDGLDNNCNNSVDEENAIGCVKYLKDGDKDGYGQSGVGKCLCKPSYPYTEFQGNDCDDTVATINPKAGEVCDTVDNNCDGLTDGAGAEGCSPFYIDKDGDGFGSIYGTPKCLCEPTGSYNTNLLGDCNDNDKATYPKAPEYCDGKDTDCDNIVDPVLALGCKPYFIDGDSDGFGTQQNISQCMCAPQSPFTSLKSGDCNDMNASINPGATEVCDSVDNDCNGKTDDGAAGGQNYYIDEDGDGWGVGNAVQICGGAKPPYSALKAGDCDDKNKAVSPGTTEIPCNGIDDNCDGVSAGGQSTYLMDFNAGAAGWTTGSTNGVNFWKLTTTSGGATPAKFTSTVYGTPNMGSMGTEKSYLLSSIVNMQGGGVIKFDTWQSNETGNYDREYVDISYDGGNVWVPAIDYLNAMWTPQKLWQTVTVTVPATLGTATTRLRFLYDTIDGCCGPSDQTGWYIDNFSATSTCK